MNWLPSRPRQGVVLSGIVLGVLSACGSPTPTPYAVPDKTAPSAYRTGECPPPPQSIAPPAGVSVTVTVANAQPRIGENVTLEVRVRHGGSRQVDYWTSGQRFDVWVEGPRGMVWLWSREATQGGDVFLAHLARLRLLPGHEIVERVEWRQTGCGTASARAVPGRYTVRAAWLALDEDGGGLQGWWSDPVDFDIG